MLALTRQIGQNGRMPARGLRLIQCLALSLALAASQGASAGRDAQDVTIYALGLVGVTYKFGGTQPESGLDRTLVRGTCTRKSPAPACPGRPRK